MCLYGESVMYGTLPILAAVGLGLFAIGTVVGSFVNVCVYRLPWQKSVIWPGSRCPCCYQEIAAHDNVPIVGWIALRGACRGCGGRIAARYPLVEALVGILFASVYVIDVVLGPRTIWGEIPASLFLTWLFHAFLVALLATATFMDYDLTIIPDSITVTGMIVGISLGACFPEIRPEPSRAASHWGGFWVGMNGLLVAGLLTQFFRLTGSLALRREAMGFGDVTLMAMIGAFLGWQAAVLTFFIAPFFAIAHMVWKAVAYLGKLLSGRKLTSADREIPFGPYLSMAAVTLVFSWRWFWPGWARSYFEISRMLFWWILGLEM